MSIISVVNPKKRNREDIEKELIEKFRFIFPKNEELEKHLHEYESEYFKRLKIDVDVSKYFYKNLIELILDHLTLKECVILGQCSKTLHEIQTHKKYDSYWMNRFIQGTNGYGHHPTIFRFIANNISVHPHVKYKFKNSSDDTEHTHYILWYDIYRYYNISKKQKYGKVSFSSYYETYTRRLNKNYPNELRRKIQGIPLPKKSIVDFAFKFKFELPEKSPMYEAFHELSTKRNGCWSFVEIVKTLLSNTFYAPAYYDYSSAPLLKKRKLDLRHRLVQKNIVYLSSDSQILCLDLNALEREYGIHCVQNNRLWCRSVTNGILYQSIKYFYVLTMTNTHIGTYLMEICSKYLFPHLHPLMKR
jgi:hypothetical protein